LFQARLAAVDGRLHGPAGRGSAQALQEGTAKARKGRGRHKIPFLSSRGEQNLSHPSSFPPPSRKGTKWRTPDLHPDSSGGIAVAAERDRDVRDGEREGNPSSRCPTPGVFPGILSLPRQESGAHKPEAPARGHKPEAPARGTDNPRGTAVPLAGASG